MQLTELLKTDIHGHELQRENRFGATSPLKLASLVSPLALALTFGKKSHRKVQHRRLIL